MTAPTVLRPRPELVSSRIAARTTTPAPTSRGHRLPVVALVVFLATLPLEWITVSRAIGGFVKPFHLAGFALIGTAVARWRPRELLGPVLRRFAPVYVGYAVVLSAALLASLARSDPFVPGPLIVRQAFYAGTSLVVAGVVVRLVARPARALAWSGVLTLAVLVSGLAVALATQRVNPLTVIGDALSQGDPDIIIRRLFRNSFRVDPELGDVGSNLRHKVFVGLLVAVLLGFACRPLIDRRRRAVRLGLLAGGVAGCAVVVLSLSRSTIICLVVTVLLIPSRALVRNRLRPAQAAGVAVAVLIVLGAIVSPAGDVVATRFTTSESYQARLEAAGPSFVEEFGDAALLGTTDAAVEKSPHNLVLHSWLAGGVLAGVGAAIAIGSVLVMWWREARQYVSGRPGWTLAVGHVWVLGLGVIPLVRAVTAGNQFHMVEWASVGLFLGFVLANERARAAGELAGTGGPRR